MFKTDIEYRPQTNGKLRKICLIKDCNNFKVFGILCLGHSIDENVINEANLKVDQIKSAKEMMHIIIKDKVESHDPGMNLCSYMCQ